MRRHPRAGDAASKEKKGGNARLECNRVGLLTNGGQAQTGDDVTVLA